MTASESRFAAIYREHYPKVYGFCRRRVALDRVDDVVAETFLVAWRRIDDVPSTGALPWLLTVAYRVVGNQWRGNLRRRRLKERLASTGIEQADKPDDMVVVSDELARVLEAATYLKREDRELLMMTVWDELSHKEIASILGINHNAVKQRVYDARKRLTKEFNRLEKRQIGTPAARKGGAL